ncbi:uncharacterized protein LOC143282487 [Babylonia areolata]|uniref:uncharacterized protein LOC143282487 n=1 Tax=Babylonia areolata TaxID=304850 RepID=UPI003FD3C4E3
MRVVEILNEIHTPSPAADHKPKPNFRWLDSFSVGVYVREPRFPFFTMSFVMRDTVLRFEKPPPSEEKLEHRPEQMFQKSNTEYQDLLLYLRKLNDEWKDMNRTKVLTDGEVKVANKRVRRIRAQCQGEVRQLAKATIMMRRRALEVQLRREMDEYNTELAAVGKTFFTERI